MVTSSEIATDKRRVVITGIGAVTPSGIGAEVYFSDLISGTCQIRTIPPVADVSVSGSCEIAVPPNECRVECLAMRALSEALNDARFSNPCSQLGLCLGTAIGATVEIEEAFLDGSGDADHLIDFGLLTKRLSQKFGLHGPTFTSTTGCVAGIDAFGIAYDLVATGRASGMAVVGADATNSPIVFSAFERIGAVTKSIDPSTASQPFGRDRDGFVLGEAGAALVLESLETAHGRGAHIYAEVLGWHSICSAYHMTSLRTDGSDLIYLMQELLERVCISAEEIDFLDCHGTSTNKNDVAEANAIGNVFKNSNPRVSIVAQKSIFGHSLGASNVVEIVGLCKMLETGQVPRLRNAELVDDELNVYTDGRSFTLGKSLLAMKLSSSFSGIHSGCVLKSMV